MRTCKRLLVCILAAVMIIISMPMVAKVALSDRFVSNYEALAATLRVKCLWASKHEIGKVTFKWTKVAGVSVSGWNLKYRMRKIGGNNKWSGWTTKSYRASTMQAVISIPKNHVIEIHAQAKGDSTWSAGIITTPAGGKYQAMKNTFVKDSVTNRRIKDITMGVGSNVTISPDFEYSVKNYKSRPKLYPNHILYDLADNSILRITDDKGKKYEGGILEGRATIKALRIGATTIICRAPNGRTYPLIVNVEKKGISTKMTTMASDARTVQASNSSSARSSGTVFWTPNGSVYHISRNCPTLEKSKTIKTGTIMQSGKSRVCRVCGN